MVTPVWEACTPATVNESDVRELAKKVRVIEDPALTAMMPARRPARIRLTLTDGRVFKAQALVNKGDFEDPDSQDDLKRKYLDLSSPVWGDKAARTIYEVIGELETLRDMNHLTALIPGIR